MMELEDAFPQADQAAKPRRLRKKDLEEYVSPPHTHST